MAGLDPARRQALAIARRAGVEARVLRVEARGGHTLDFEEVCVGDRHHEFRWMPSYGEPFLLRALDVYRERTRATIDVARVRRLHALVALEQFGWGLREPDEHRRTGRTLADTRAWAECALDTAR